MSQRPPLYWTLREIARLERGGFRAARLTEPGHARWHRVRRRLGWVDFIELLHEDLSATFPTAFDLGAWSRRPTDGLSDDEARSLIEEACRPDDTDTASFLRAASRGLGLHDGGNIASALPRLAPHQRALELPGAGGRIAAYQVTTYGLSLREHFTFVIGSDEDRVAIGLVAAELRADAPRVLGVDQLLPKNLSDVSMVFGVRAAPGVEHVASRVIAAAPTLEVRWA